MTTQRPRTIAEIAALPIGPTWRTEEHEVTAEDRQRGYKILYGRQINVRPITQTIRIPLYPSVISFYSEEHDLLGYTDEAGIQWTLGRYADGQWFRGHK